jgi:hypothetical protein
VNSLVHHTVRYDPVPIVYDHGFVEVAEAKVPAKMESAVPEWIRNPRVEIIIIPGGWIIGDYRRSIVVIVVIDHSRDVIPSRPGDRCASRIYARRVCRDRQT